jgi:hypothetical protein
MANVSFTVSYWKQSTGLTGQNLSEANQRKFSRVAKKYNKVMKQDLSKTRLYLASREAARKLKAEYGGHIRSHSICTFDLLCTAVYKELKKRPHEIDMGVFKVNNIADLAIKSRKRKTA